MPPISEATANFHRIASEGSLEELKACLESGIDVNAAGRMGRTALMLALEKKDLAKTKLLIEQGADPELTDDFNYTALYHAVYADFADGVRLLIEQGVDRGFNPKYPLKKLTYDFPLPKTEMPSEMKGVISEVEWLKSLEIVRTATQKALANPTVEPIISEVQSVEILKLFLEAGDDLNLAPSEIKRAFVGLQKTEKLEVTKQEYQQHKSPTFGKTNPERIDYPFWRDMIRTGGNAYSARAQFDDTNGFSNPGPVWCYDRFGSTLTPLPDGRFVQIGGEHEDYYDPDFFIYNDVVVHDGHGDFQIYGYPQAVFPQTDFHTATLCQDQIYIIGCLGYVEQRKPAFTPVYRLSLATWEIEAVKTSGEMPGWIHKHRAQYNPEQNAIRITGGEVHVVNNDEKNDLARNDREFELNLTRFEWRRIK